MILSIFNDTTFHSIFRSTRDSRAHYPRPSTSHCLCSDSFIPVLTQFFDSILLEVVRFLAGWPSLVFAMLIREGT